MRLTLVIAFILICNFTFAQNGKSTIGIILDVGSIQLQDKALNNLKHTGTINTVGLSFSGQSSKGIIHYIQLTYEHSALKSQFEEGKNSSFWHPSLTYTVQKSFSSTFKFGGYFYGGYQVMEFENWDDSHLYWLTSYQIGTSMEFIPFNKLITRVKFPLLSVVSRSRNEITNKVDSDEFSEIFKLIHSNAVLATPLKYQTLDFQIAYIITDSKKLSLEINTALKFTHANLQKSKEFTYSSIVAGLELKYKLN